MSPLEKLAAAANKLIQIGNYARDEKTRVALAEIAASIRGSVATIRAAIEGEVKRQPRPAKFTSVAGDETQPPPAAKAKRKSPAKPPGQSA